LMRAGRRSRKTLKAWSKRLRTDFRDLEAMCCAVTCHCFRKFSLSTERNKTHSLAVTVDEYNSTYERKACEGFAGVSFGFRFSLTIGRE